MGSLKYDQQLENAAKAGINIESVSSENLAGTVQELFENTTYTLKAQAENPGITYQ